MAYALLGLGPDATAAEVKAAWKGRAKLLHPDVHQHSDGLREEAQRATQQLNNAYDLLRGLQESPRGGAPPEPTPRPEKETEVVYSTSNWRRAPMTQLRRALDRAAIPHWWDGADLVVDKPDEEAVDVILADIEMMKSTSAGSPNGTDVIYGTSDWSDRARARLRAALLTRRIPHAWEGPDLEAPRV